MSDDGLIVLCWDHEKNITVIQLNPEEPPSWYYDLPKSDFVPFYHMRVEDATSIRFQANEYFALENQKGTYRTPSVQFSQLTATKALINIILNNISPDKMSFKHDRDSTEEDEPPRKRKRGEVQKTRPPEPSLPDHRLLEQDFVGLSLHESHTSEDDRLETMQWSIN